MRGRPNPDHWRNRLVLVTGHTGFKGSWLTHVLKTLGANVHGLALAPPTRPAMFAVSQASELLDSDTRLDVRDFESVRSVILELKPQTIFHLAAQPLVRRSSAQPLETITTNIDGTASILDAAAMADLECAVVVVTTDKVYRPELSARPHSEADSLGGRDVYSASKACAELLTAAFRDSILRQTGVTAVTARSGNVIGGGDWSTDRLMPDLFRAVTSGAPLVLRHPEATRPWQHVLDPIRGYILLAEASSALQARGPWAFNFGPAPGQVATVNDLLGRVAELGIDMPRIVVDQNPDVPETMQLALESSLAAEILDWLPWWGLDQAIAATCDWHFAWQAGKDMVSFTREQIHNYEDAGPP